MWAGDRPRGKPVRLILKAHFVGLDDRADARPYVYTVGIGLPTPNTAAFTIEPLIKVEHPTTRGAGARS